jgi:hypothetical protein
MRIKIQPMKPIDNGLLTGWLTRLVALRAAAKGTTKDQEALALKAELSEKAKKLAQSLNYLNIFLSK